METPTDSLIKRNEPHTKQRGGNFETATLHIHLRTGTLTRERRPGPAALAPGEAAVRGLQPAPRAAAAAHAPPPDASASPAAPAGAAAAAPPSARQP